MECHWCSRMRLIHRRVPRPTGASRSFTTHSPRLNSAFQRPQLEAVHNSSSASKNLPQVAIRRSRPTSRPNDRPPSLIHGADLSKRLGVQLNSKVMGIQEWQTSTYHYNKQTTRPYPVAANTTNKLLEYYAALKPSQFDRNGHMLKEPKFAVAMRRKSALRKFVSTVKVKDFGTRVVLNAYVYDGHQDSETKEARKRSRRRTRGGPDAEGRNRR